MINFGRYPGKGMPNVYIPATFVDRILEGIAVLLVVAVWVLALVFYPNLPVSPKGLFIMAGIATFTTVLFLWSSRAPIRFINFPVPLTEHNVRTQYWLMAKCVRVMNIIMNLLFLFAQFTQLEGILDVKKGLFSMLAAAMGILLGAALIVYFIFARRYR